MNETIDMLKDDLRRADRMRTHASAGSDLRARIDRWDNRTRDRLTVLYLERDLAAEGVR